MGFLDDAKNEAENLAESHPDQVSQGLDKAEGMINEETGEKYQSQIDAGVDKARDELGLPDNN